MFVLITLLATLCIGIVLYEISTFSIKTDPQTDYERIILPLLNGTGSVVAVVSCNSLSLRAIYVDRDGDGICEAQINIVPTGAFIDSYLDTNNDGQYDLVTEKNDELVTKKILDSSILPHCKTLDTMPTKILEGSCVRFSARHLNETAPTRNGMISAYGCADNMCDMIVEVTWPITNDIVKPFSKITIHSGGQIQEFIPNAMRL